MSANLKTILSRIARGDENNSNKDVFYTQIPTLLLHLRPTLLVQWTRRLRRRDHHFKLRLSAWSGTELTNRTPVPLRVPPGAMPPGPPWGWTHSRVLTLGTAAVLLRRRPRPGELRLRLHVALTPVGTTLGATELTLGTGQAQHHQQAVPLPLGPPWSGSWPDYVRGWTACS